MKLSPEYVLVISIPSQVKIIDVMNQEVLAVGACEVRNILPSMTSKCQELYKTIKVKDALASLAEGNS